MCVRFGEFTMGYKSSVIMIPSHYVGTELPSCLDNLGRVRALQEDGLFLADCLYELTMDVTNDDDPAVSNLLPGEDCMSRPWNRQPAGAAPVLCRASRLGVRPEVRTGHVWPLRSPLLSAGLCATMRLSCRCDDS
eukprot:SM000079S22440  [mRNA]  locus=s79:260878:261657:+ [translate_table: standard]